jgi:hypothetical protein
LEASSLPSSISGSCSAWENYFGSSPNLLPKLLNCSIADDDLTLNDNNENHERANLQINLEDEFYEGIY